MPQLNILPVDVPQSTDYKAEVSQSSTKEHSNDERFSEMVDRHLKNEKTGESEADGKKSQKVDNNGNKASETSHEMKKEDKKIKSFPDDETDNAKVESKPDKAILKVSAVASDNNNANQGASQNDLLDVFVKESESEEIKEQSNSENSSQTSQDKKQESNSELEKSEFFISIVNSSQQILQDHEGAPEQESQAKEVIGNIVKNNLPKDVKPLIVEDNLPKGVKPLVVEDYLPKGVKPLVVGDISPGKTNQDKLRQQFSAIVDSADSNVDKVKGNENPVQKDEAIFDLLIDSTTKLKFSSDSKDQQLVKDSIVTSKSSNGKAELTIKSNEQLYINDDVSVKELTAENEEERVQLANLTQIANKSNKVEGNQNSQSNKRSVNISNKNSELAALDVSDENINEKVTFKGLVETTQGIQSVSVQPKSVNSTSSINYQEKINAPKLDQQSAGNQSEQHKQSNSEEPKAGHVDINSIAEADAVPAPNEKSSMFEQRINSENTTAHLTNASQTTKVQESESQQSVIEEISHAIVNENNIQTKTNAAALNETISIFRKDFTEAVKDKVMVMISQKLQQLDIRLDPPELGNVHVRVNLQNEQAVVNFMVQNQQAKEAFEENLNKLKDMLAEHGVDVGDANVEQQSQQSAESETDSHFNGQGQNSNDNELESAETVLSANLFKTSSSSVDYYA
mgnify:CR=1 FL=1